MTRTGPCMAAAAAAVVAAAVATAAEYQFLPVSRGLRNNLRNLERKENGQWAHCKYWELISANSKRSLSTHKFFHVFQIKRHLERVES